MILIISSSSTLFYCYIRWWQIPYYWVGCKLYDLFAGREALESSYLLTRSKALDAFPMLKKDELVGALVYYDGKFNTIMISVLRENGADM